MASAPVGYWLCKFPWEELSVFPGGSARGPAAVIVE